MWLRVRLNAIAMPVRLARLDKFLRLQILSDPTKQPKHFSNFQKTYFTGSKSDIYVKIRDEEYKCD